MVLLKSHIQIYWACHCGASSPLGPCGYGVRGQVACLMYTRGKGGWFFLFLFFFGITMGSGLDLHAKLFLLENLTSGEWAQLAYSGARRAQAAEGPHEGQAHIIIS